MALTRDFKHTIIQRGADAVTASLQSGLGAAMNPFNRNDSL